jgi:hypothetical protein
MRTINLALNDIDDLTYVFGRYTHHATPLSPLSAPGNSAPNSHPKSKLLAAGVIKKKKSMPKFSPWWE